MRAFVVFLCFPIMALGCAPEWDTEVTGYVEVSVSFSPDISRAPIDEPVWARSTIVRVVNGDQKTRLFWNERTRFINTGTGSKINWDFDRIYRVRGKKNWIDPEINREGPLRIAALPDTTQKLWAVRVERLSEEESRSLIDARQIAPRNKSPDAPNALPNAHAESDADRNPSQEEGAREAQAHFLRALAEDTRERIREFEISRAGVAGELEVEDDRAGNGAGNDNLTQLRAYLTELQSQIETLESDGDLPE